MKQTKLAPTGLLALFTAYLLATPFLSSCGDSNSAHSLKDYSYVEVREDYGLFGNSKTIKEESPKAIKALNDTLAYIDAYQKYCTAIKVNNDLKQSLGEVSSSPVKFKLLNGNNNDISNIQFVSKSNKEKELEKQILAMENTLQDAVDKYNNETNHAGVVDSAKTKSLQKNFTVKTDEFSNDNAKWYKPKSAPKYTNQNGIYCYFQTVNNKPTNLRFRVQYYNDDWLFFSRVQFSIDGEAFDYIPSNIETDSGNGGYIWEWFDESLTANDKDLIYALSNAKNAKMKFIGRQYSDVKTVTNSQIKSIKETIELFNSMGGHF